jgi:ATP-dependent Clp protease ATP-binding subunit ClpA
MPRRLSADARKLVLASATEEARRRGDRRLGTDHLLLGLLHDEDCRAAKALGVSLAGARAAAEALDVAALAAVGVEIDAVGQGSPVSFGRQLPPLTSGARAVFKRAIDEARPFKSGRIDTTHFLLALLALQRPDPAAELLDALAVDRQAVRGRLGGPAEGETG